MSVNLQYYSTDNPSYLVSKNATTDYLLTKVLPKQPFITADLYVFFHDDDDTESFRGKSLITSVNCSTGKSNLGTLQSIEQHLPSTTLRVYKIYCLLKLQINVIIIN